VTVKQLVKMVVKKHVKRLVKQIVKLKQMLTQLVMESGIGLLKALIQLQAQNLICQLIYGLIS